MACLEIAFQSPHIPPDILTQLLNLAEFMEHDEKALPIDIRVLGMCPLPCWCTTRVCCMARQLVLVHLGPPTTPPTTTCLGVSASPLPSFTPRCVSHRQPCQQVPRVRQGPALQGDGVPLQPGRLPRVPHRHQQPAGAARGRCGHPEARPASATEAAAAGESLVLIFLFLCGGLVWRWLSVPPLSRWPVCLTDRPLCFGDFPLVWSVLRSPWCLSHPWPLSWRPVRFRLGCLTLF